MSWGIADIRIINYTKNCGLNLYMVVFKKALPKNIC